MPSTTLPEDTSVKIPAAVLRGSARASEIHKAAYEAPQDPPQDPPPQDPPQEPPIIPPPTSSTPPVRVENGSLEQQLSAMKGRYDKAQLQVNQQGDRITYLENLIATLQAPQPPVTPPELRADSFLTKEQRDAYGDEFLDVVAARAREALKPELDAKEKEIETLKRQLTGVAGNVQADARSRMMNELQSKMPNFETVNTDPAFINWLRLQDPFSGVIRQQLLNAAFDRNDTARVLAFFESFQREEAAVAPLSPAPTPPPDGGGRISLESLAAPGRARQAPAAPGAQANKPVITRAQIAKFYADVTAGRYTGKDAEKAANEKMIFEAQAEGRIR